MYSCHIQTSDKVNCHTHTSEVHVVQLPYWHIWPHPELLIYLLSRYSCHTHATMEAELRYSHIWTGTVTMNIWTSAHLNTCTSTVAISKLSYITLRKSTIAILIHLSKQIYQETVQLPKPPEQIKLPYTHLWESTVAILIPMLLGKQSYNNHISEQAQWQWTSEHLHIWNLHKYNCCHIHVSKQAELHCSHLEKVQLPYSYIWVSRVIMRQYSCQNHTSEQVKLPYTHLWDSTIAILTLLSKQSCHIYTSEKVQLPYSHTWASRVATHTFEQSVLHLHLGENS